ncbi:unnamed protein product [Urochloa humidicola]
MCAVVTPFALPSLLAAPGGYCGGYDDNAADLDLDAVLRGIRSIRIPAADFATPVPMDSAAVVTPTTPVASLPAPFSYGDDDAAIAEDATASTTTTQKNPPKKQHQHDPGEPYDAGIDATLRAMENDPAEHPSPIYLWTVQAGGITMADRAHIVSWMHSFSRYYGLAPGTLHRAVSYTDRFLSTNTYISDGYLTHLLLLGAVAVFAAAKYDSGATLALTADTVAWHVSSGCTRRAVVDAERVLFATLGCRLGGPTAYDFVDHFTRNGAGGSTHTVRLVAHYLADVTLLDYRSIRFLPSAVAASAIALAKMAVNPAVAASWISDEMVEVTGYALEDVAECMAEIEEMRGLQGYWPGCAQMTEDFVCSYGFLPI